MSVKYVSRQKYKYLQWFQCHVDYSRKCTLTPCLCQRLEAIITSYTHDAHLVEYPEYMMEKNKNAETIVKFLFEIMCRWGAIETIITDNAPQYLQAVQILVDKYHVHHIRISPYNLRAAGPIERCHYDVHEAIIKAAEGDESKWPIVVPSVFWAKHVTILKSTGYSPYYMAHGVEPLLPFDLAEATYLAPVLNGRVTTETLIAERAKMLMKRPQGPTTHSRTHSKG